LLLSYRVLSEVRAFVHAGRKLGVAAN
jgi:hypothetical protein